MAGFRYRPFRTQPRRLSRMLLGRGFVTNQLPAITVPGAQSAVSNVALAIAGTSITDPDSNPQTITLVSSLGAAISLASLTGITGSGNGTSSLSYAGTLANILTALATITYTSTVGGADTITITTDDGAGGTDSDTISVSVTTPLLAGNAFSGSAFSEAAFSG